ncbi:hypothetical protein Cni_G14929 [Canna indica]|uniref:Uncharacterized protein n=1 Tax=Canna indica TaxID=4628 RepID=A0AAQ3KH55_9LILI|nr:hypothetical protein Cni_G14929 [Canna indica]
MAPSNPRLQPSNKASSQGKRLVFWARLEGSRPELKQAQFCDFDEFQQASWLLNINLAQFSVLLSQLTSSPVNSSKHYQQWYQHYQQWAQSGITLPTSLKGVGGHILLEVLALHLLAIILQYSLNSSVLLLSDEVISSDGSDS